MILSATSPDSAAAPRSLPVDADSPLGINLSALVDYSDEDPFRDAFLLSREWIPQCVAGRDPGCTSAKAWDTGESARIATDRHGWVTRLPGKRDGVVFTRVSTLMLVSAEPHNDYGGRWVVTYRGRGTMEYSLGARLVSRSPGRDVIEVADDGWILLSIVRTDRRNPLRDISVTRDGGDSLTRQPYNPTWVERLEPFRTLRFMDWMRTNDSTQRRWADRPRPTDARYSTDRGAPVEAMVDVVNAVDAEPWFTVPHRADDAYVTAMARLVAKRLDPGRTVYVEYSNEVWNPAFRQGSDIERWAAREFRGTSASGFTQRINWHGKRTAEVCQLWRDEFGRHGGQVVCVLGAQAANPWTAQEALECPLWRNDPDNPARGRSCQDLGIDAVAIAPYVGGYLGEPEQAARTVARGLDGLFADLLGPALTETTDWVDAYDDLAHALGVRLLAYEGGQHLVGFGSAQGNEALTGLFTRANRDPRMGAVYDALLEHWRGGSRHGTPEVFAAFSLAGRVTQFGSWGALEYIEQESSPKYAALERFSRVECWWAACAIGS